MIADPSLGSAADDIARILGGGDTSEETAAEEPMEETAEATETEPVEGEPTGEAESELDEGEAEEPGEESAEQDGTEELHTVPTGDGSTEEVTYGELIAGHLRQADYTRKTMALSEERTAFQAEREGVQGERSQYTAALAQLHALIQNAAGAEPDPALAQSDPNAYIQQRAEYDARKGQLDTIAAEHQRVTQLQQTQATQQRQEYVTEQEKQLLIAIPEWNTPETHRNEWMELGNYALQSGYTPEQWARVSHHLDVIMLRKAMKYDQLQQKGRQTAKKAPKTAKPGTAQQKAPRTKRRRDSINQATATGHIDDATRAIAEILKG